MPKFRVSITDGVRGLTDIYIEANDPAHAVSVLQDQGIDIIAIHHMEFHSKAIAQAALLSPRQFSLFLLCQELIVLIDAGLTIVETMRTLHDKETHVGRKAVLLGLLTGISEGQRFSVACELFPKLFPDLFVSSIRAHESTGSISQGLKRYLEYHQEMGMLKNRIINMMIYPTIVMTAGLGVITFLFLFVLPRFAKVFNNSRSEIPSLSRHLMEMSVFLNEHLDYFLIGVLSMVVVIIALIKIERLRNIIFFPIVLPVLRWKPIAYYRHSRVFRTIALLLESGLRLPQSIRLSSKLLRSASERKLFDTVVRRVEEGSSFVESLSFVGLDDPVTKSLLVAGERSGSLGEMLMRASTFREQIFSRWLEKFMRVLEPLIMLLLGTIVGGIILMIYMPIFDITSSVM